MRRNGFVIAVAVVGAMSSGVMAQKAQPKAVDYESLCKLDRSGPRRVAWMSATATTKADTVRTQVERWRDANRSHLNARQVAHLDEVLATMTPTFYAEGKEGELARQKAQSLSRVTPQLFTADEMRGMSVVDGTCIAATK